MSSFSIKWLLLAVAYVAVSITALLNANDYWQNGFESAAIILLLTSILGSIFCSGPRRAFWTGWLVFGAAWALLAFGQFEFSSRWRRGQFTTTVLDALHGYTIVPTHEHFPNTPAGNDAALGRARDLGVSFTRLSDGRYQVTSFQPNRSSFTAVGNRLVCIPFALLGSVIATWFWRKRESSQA